MPTFRFRIPVYVPSWAESAARRFRQGVRFATGNAIDLSGDREIEWAYVAARMGDGPGRLLDFGASEGSLSIVAAQRKFSVLALDLGMEKFAWKHPNVEFLQSDLLKVDLPAESFDVILNCSAVEHVGLTGRYGVAAKESDGDLAAMAKFRALMKTNGRMLLTVPCGQDAAIAPWHRVYGERRLPKLLQGFEELEQEFWAKKKDNRWYRCERDSALAFTPSGHPTDPTKCSYALGCFVLSRTQ